MDSIPTVAVFLATYQGEAYLEAQLDSFFSQDFAQWRVWASDDGSTDRTLPILKKYQAIWGQDKLCIQSGPRKGVTANFLHLTCDERIQADYYAYADQDDIWDPDKLTRAIAWLTTVSKDIPALYCARTRLVDAHNHEIGFSPLFKRPPSFVNSLIQCAGGGNTMVFNDAARQLLQAAGNDSDILAHDWHAYMVVSGCGGQVFYDPIPSIRYRQHGANIIGMSTGWKARLQRVQRLVKGEFRGWSDNNIRVLQRMRSRLMPENRATLDRFAVARGRWLIPRLMQLKSLGLYRQTRFGNIGLVVAVILNRL